MVRYKILAVVATFALLACNKQSNTTDNIQHDVNNLVSSLSVRSTTGTQVDNLGLFVDNQTYPANSADNAELELVGSTYKPTEGTPIIKWGGKDASIAVTAYAPYADQVENNEIYIEMPQNQQNSNAVSNSDILWGRNPKIIFGQGPLFIEMKHIMSKLELEIKYVGEYTLSPQNYTVEKNIIYGFYTASSFNPRTGEVSTNTSLYREITASGSAMRFEAIMVPQQADGSPRFVVSFVKEHLSGQTKIFSTKLNFPNGEQNLRSGHSYKAVIELGHAYDELLSTRSESTSTLSTMVSDVIVSDWNTGKVLNIAAGDGNDLWLGPNGDRYGGIGTQSNPYKIRTANDFKEFAILVNSGKNDFYSRTIALDADIRIDGNDFTSTGTATNPFTGTFDGAGHKLTFADYNIESADDQVLYIGMFGYCRNASLKNIVIEGKLNIKAKQVFGGALVGVGENTTLENCRNMATIMAHVINGATQPSYVAGIAGRATELRNCSNKGNVTITNDSRTKLCVAGGAAGAMVMQGCANSGNITVVNNSNIEILVGGVLGVMEYSGSSRSIAMLNGGSINVDGVAVVAGIVANAPYVCIGACSTATVGGSATSKAGLLGVEVSNSSYFRGCFFDKTRSVGLPALVGAGSSTANVEAVSGLATDNLWADNTIDSLNEAIKRWNIDNPTLQCTNHFIVGAQGPILR